MKKTEPDQHEICKELSSLIYFCYDGNERTIATPTKRDFIDVLDGLKHLKVLVKYMKFDIEATRRENGYLRKLLENK